MPNENIKERQEEKIVRKTKQEHKKKGKRSLYVFTRKMRTPTEHAWVEKKVPRSQENHWPKSRPKMVS
jgi:hypothetical protein